METLSMEIADSAPLLHDDVTEQLSDLVPYRCPKCGHQRKFATLRELRLHLQHDHAFQMGCIKPNQRPGQDPGRGAMFHKDARKPSNVKTQNNLNKREFGKFKMNWPSKSSSESSNQFQGDNLNTREDSPLLDSFKADTEKLERELQMAKQNELKNKTKSINNLVGNTGNDNHANRNVNEDFKRVIGDMNTTNDLGISVKQPVSRTATDNYTTRNENEDFKRVLGDMRATVTHDLGYPPIKRPATKPTSGSGFDVKGALAALNGEVMRSRVNLWETSDELYRSQDVLNGMEHAAEEKCKQQRDIIHNLLTEIQLKDKRLQDTDHQHSQLNEERSRLFEETETIVREANGHNQKLQRELSRRGEAIEEVSDQMEQLRRQSELELQTKDKDLQNVKEKLGRLEWEREKMLGEMEKLLQKADTDSRELRHTVQEKEKQLHKVNAELNDIRSSQQNMLEKTMSVYRKAEEGQEMMKTVVVAKDDQLRAALDRIEQMKAMQQQLVQESRNLTDQSDENTTSMKKMLKMKEDQVTEAMKQLQFLRKEKAQLEDSSCSLAEKASASVAAVKNMKSIVRQRENDLKHAQGELHNLKNHLHAVADKERAARAKLETFIEDLIDRAEKAESELHALRSQSSNTSEPTHRAENVAQDPISNRMMQSTDFSADDITERVSLPQMIPPPKPPRTKIKSNSSSKRAPEWRQHLNTEQIDPADTKIPPAPSDHVDSKRPPIPRTSHRPEKSRIDKKNTTKNIAHNAEPESNSLCTNYHELPEELDLRRNKSKPLNSKDTPSRKLSNNKAQFDGATANTATNDIAERHTRDKQAVANHGKSRVNGMQKTSRDKDADIEKVLKELNNIPTPPKTKYKSGSNRSQVGKTRHDDGFQRDNVSRNSPKRQAVSAPSYRDEDFTEEQHSSRRARRHRDSEEARTGTKSDHLYVKKYPISEGFSAPKKHPANGKYVELEEEEYAKIESPVPKHRKGSDHTRQNPGKNHDSYTPTPHSRKLRYVNPRDNGDTAELLNTGDDDEFIYIPKPRPGTIGMSRDSPQHIQKSNPNSKTRRKPRLVNPDFDSDYPSAHRSTGNLQARENHRRRRSKRSKSHSPVAIDPGYQRSSMHDSDNETEEPVQRPSRYTIHKFKGSDVSDADNVSDGYVELHDDDEDSDPGKFDQIMDENGILWEDDTLPDVSDSEFDRVSPSGSEAIATKKVCTTGVKPGTTSHTSKHSKHADADDTRPLLSHHSSQEKSFNKSVSKGTKSEEMSIKRKPLIGSKTTVKPVKLVKENSFDCHEPNCKLNPETENLFKSKTFRPIKPEPRYSSSDKEMTSGAKEVNMHMRRSPFVQVHGSIESMSHSLSSQILDTAIRSSASNNTNSDRNLPTTVETTEPKFAAKSFHSSDTKTKPRHETLDETLKRVTSKYKSKRDDDIDTKIKSISDKYAKRRQEIVSSRAMPPHSSRLPPRATYNASNTGRRKEYTSSEFSPTRSFTGHANIAHGLSDPNHQLMAGQPPYNQVHGMAVPTYPGMLPDHIHPGMAPGGHMYTGGMPGPVHYPAPPHHVHPETQHLQGQAPHQLPDHQHYRRTAEFPYLFPYFHGYSPEAHSIPNTQQDVDNTVETGKSGLNPGPLANSDNNATTSLLKTNENANVTANDSISNTNMVENQHDVDGISNNSEALTGERCDSIRTADNTGMKKGNDDRSYNRVDEETQGKHDDISSLNSCDAPISKTSNVIGENSSACEEKYSNKDSDCSFKFIPQNDNNSLSSRCMTINDSGTAVNQQDAFQYKMLEAYSESDQLKSEFEPDRVDTDFESDHIETEMELDSVAADVYSYNLQTEREPVRLETDLKSDSVETEMEQNCIATDIETGCIETYIDSDHEDTDIEQGHVETDIEQYHVEKDIEQDRIETGVKSACVQSDIDSDHEETGGRLSPFEHIGLDDYPVAKSPYDEDNAQGVDRCHRQLSTPRALPLSSDAILEDAMREATSRVAKTTHYDSNTLEVDRDAIHECTMREATSRVAKSPQYDSNTLGVDIYAIQEGVVNEATSPGEMSAALQADMEEIDGLVLAADIKTSDVGGTDYSEDFSEMTENKLNVDTSLNSVSEGFSMFAEPILDQEDVSYDAASNTQSMPDISENLSVSGELEQDTDTEIVRQEFYEKTQQIKDMIESSQSDYSEVYKMKATRKATSSASSQG